MKTLIISFLLISHSFQLSFAHSSVLEENLQKICAEVMTFDPDSNTHLSNPVHFHFEEQEETLWLARRMSQNESAYYSFESITQKERQHLFNWSQTIRGLHFYKDHIWILENVSLKKVDLQGNLQGQFSLTNEFGARARSMSTSEDGVLFISQGEAGLVRFDLEKEGISWRKEVSGVFRDGARSFPVSSQPRDNHLYAVLTGASPNSFHGVVKLDSYSGELLESAEYHRRLAGVISPNASLKLYNDQIVLNNGGWIHTINFDQLYTPRPIRPHWVPVMVGDDYPHYMMLRGEFFIQDHDLLGCGIEREIVGRRVIQHSHFYRVEL